TPDFDGGTEFAPQLRGTQPKWRRIAGVVTHVFTHFPLELVVYTAEVAPRAATPDGARWVALAGLADAARPNVMRKVLAHALGLPRHDRHRSQSSTGGPVMEFTRRSLTAATGATAATTFTRTALGGWEPSERYPDPTIQILDPSF